jgi:vacuolar-type H+-ATPase subunit C/Vma6
MATALRDYAFAQSRVRGRLGRLAGRRTLEALAAAPDEAAVVRELEARGRPDRRESVRRAFGAVLAWLPEASRELVARYRDRHEWENVAVLLRGAERGLPAAERLSLLQPVGALGTTPAGRWVAEAPSLAEAVARLPAQPYGEPLRRVLAAAPRGAVDRFRLEAVAEREAWERIGRAIEALRPAAERRSAARVLGTRLDAVSLLRFLRLRTEHALAPQELLALAIRAGHRIGRPERALLAHAPPSEWSERLAHTPYASALEAWDDAAAVEAGLNCVVRAAARRELAGPPFRIGLVLAYLVLLELEAADLRRALEGRRLGRSAGWICAGLVTGDA